jgi:nucleoside-diphosphate-sugar epimerase
MKALITGYSGFLGRHLARALRAEGVQIRVLLHQLPVPRREFAREANEVLWGSIDDAATIRRAVQGVQIVVHSAWAHSARDAPRPTVNENAATLLFTESARAGVRCFALISSVAVYGMASKADAILDESSPVAAGEELRYIYPSEKIRVESLLRSQTASGMRLGIFRPGPIIDDHKGPCKKIVHLGGRAFAVGLGTGRNHLPYIHAQDVTAAVASWLKNGKDGDVFNVTPSSCQTAREWYRSWGEVSGQRLTPLFFTPTLARILFLAVKALKRILGRSNKADVKYALASATRDLIYSNGALKAALGWRDEATARYTGHAANGKQRQTAG